MSSRLAGAINGKIKDYDEEFDGSLLEQCCAFVPDEDMPDAYAEIMRKGKGWVNMSIVLEVCGEYEKRLVKRVLSKSEELARKTAQKIHALIDALHRKFGGGNITTNLKLLEEYERVDDSKLFEGFEVTAINTIYPDKDRFVYEAFYTLDKVEAKLESYYREGLVQKHIAPLRQQEKIMTPVNQLAAAKRMRA